jgi:hypothetical protein
MLRRAQKVVGTARPEMGAGDARVSARDDFYRTRQLAREQRSSLAAEHAAAVALRPGVATMNDDLRTSIRRNGFGGDVLGGTM